MTQAQAIYMYLLMAMALGMTALGATLKQGILWWGATGGWLLFGLYNYTLSAGPWDIFYGTFFISMAMVMGTALSAARVGKGDKDDSVGDHISEDNDDAMDEYWERYHKTRDRVRGQKRRPSGRS
ncbi:hypothetical protein LCGC14_0721190 [marine sediment metagenome]|uniref:Uncharacterized protein n=1 Tax=marine sediment metagenome TaxID=412755 RepID=A0A0F9QGI0_9ZZZZ